MKKSPGILFSDLCTNPDIVGEKLIWLFLLYLYINDDLHLIYFTFWHSLEPTFFLTIYFGNLTSFAILINM